MRDSRVRTRTPFLRRRISRVKSDLRRRQSYDDHNLFQRRPFDHLLPAAGRDYSLSRRLALYGLWAYGMAACGGIADLREKPMSAECDIRTWKGSWTDGHSPLDSEIHERHEGRCDHVLVDRQIQTFAVRRYVIRSAVSSRMERDETCPNYTVG
jgi:hypothetical protein